MKVFLIFLSILSIVNDPISLLWIGKPELDDQKQPSRDVFIENGVLRIYSRFKGEHSCWSGCSIFLEQLFLWTPLEGCFSTIVKIYLYLASFYILVLLVGAIYIFAD